MVSEMMVTIHLRLTILLFLVFFAGSSRAFAQSPGEESLTDSLTTVYEYTMKHLAEMTPRELKHQKQIRREFQRRGYSNILLDVINQDGLSALLSYLRVSLQIEYSLLHKTFWIVPPDPRWGIPGIPFPDDWSFPEDPWKKE